MMKIKTLGLLIIVFCAILQTNSSPLVAREDDTEETDREFEDAFEAAYNNERARGFQEENQDDEARYFENEVRELQNEQSSYEEREEDPAGEETDRQFEDAFDQAIKDEMVRDFQEKNMDDAPTFEEEVRALQDQPSAYNRQEDETAGEETDREFEVAFDEAVKEEMSRSFEERTEGEEEMDLKQEDERPDDERQISADFDITPPEEEEERQVASGKARSTQPLRMSNLIIRPLLTKRCQGESKYSMSHCAKYLACGKTLFRGAIRTCESGQLFDAALEQCRESSKVDCKIY